MKQLPVGIETFKEIIKNDYLYVDKTQYIYNILKTYKCCFLSRPRRFGKSLILSTIESIFQENRKFFKGLWIASSDYKFKKHPVIRISLTPKSDKPEFVEKGIMTRIESIAGEVGMKLKGDTPNDLFFNLINFVYKKYKETVVILIDGYDKTVVENIPNIKLAQDNNNVLKSFFSPLKELDKIIHKIFITGVTKRDLTSASASLNNLKDISLLPEYSTLCGFTLDEIKSYFSDRIDDVYEIIKFKKDASLNYTKEDLWKDIINWYDGYNFSGHFNVFNPWSIINFFDEKNLKHIG